MATQSGLRWGGMVAVLAAVVAIPGVVIQYAMPSLLGQTLYTSAYVCTLIGLTAIFLAQSREAGILGLIGFILSFAGLVVAGTLAVAIWVRLLGLQEAVPVIRLLSVTAPIYLVGVGTLLVGLILFGIATMRAGVFPPLAGALLALGAAIELPGEMLMLLFLWPIATVLMYVGIGWMGYKLWSGEASRASRRVT